MSNIKSIGLSLLIFASVSVFGVANAATTPTAYTLAQQTCINNSMRAAIKPAVDALNNATKTQLATKQASIKKALDVLDKAIKADQAKEQSAIAAAQKISDLSARTAAIRAATLAYANSPTVKQAEVPYTAAVVAANTAYNNDPVVKQARVPYVSALVTARINAVATCVGKNAANELSNKNGSKGTSWWQKIVNFFSGLFGKSK